MRINIVHTSLTSAHQQRSGTTPLESSTQADTGKLDIVTGPQDTPPIVTRQFAPYGGRIPTCPTGVRFHIQQESDIPASTQLYNQICFAIAARHYPPGHRLPSTRQLAMQTGLHRNTISKVYRQLETDGVVEAMAGSGIYVRDQQKPRKSKRHPTSAIGASPISTGRCAGAWMGCSMPAAPCSRPENC